MLQVRDLNFLTCIQFIEIFNNEHKNHILYIYTEVKYLDKKYQNTLNTIKHDGITASGCLGPKHGMFFSLFK